MLQFQLFGMEHILQIFTWIILCSIIIKIPIILGISKIKYGRGLGIVIILLKLLETVFKIFNFSDYPIMNNLPLHLCGILVFISGLMLINKSKFLFEISYYWCFGSIIAILTPGITEKFPEILNISFFMLHFAVIFAVIYAMIYYKFAPRKWSILRAYISLLVYALFIFFINYLFKTNYMFLLEKPITYSFMDYLGSWPIYLVSLLVITYIIFYIMYLPFKNKREKYRFHSRF